MAIFCRRFSFTARVRHPISLATSIRRLPLLLQTVVRNASSQRSQDVQTVFEQTVPGASGLGLDVISAISPYSAALERVNWQPGRMEPHDPTVVLP